MDQELTHFGIKGMHWGVRRFQNEDGTLTSTGKKRYRTDRKTKLTDSVEAMREEADKSIQKYGGKNAAINAIRQEEKRKRRAATNTTITAGALIASGAGFAAGLGTGSIGALTASVVVVSSGARYVASRQRRKISEIADSKVAFIKDSDYDPNVAAQKSRD